MCMNTEHWQCPAAELSCSPQMASSRVENIFHLFSSFSVWRQFTLHCAASLSSIYFTVQRWVVESRSREMNQSDMPPSVHSSSTPMKGCLHPPLQSVLLCCPIVHSSVPVSCVYSSVHSSVAVSAVIWTWTHKISSWQSPGPSPVSWSHSPHPTYQHCSHSQCVSILNCNYSFEVFSHTISITRNKIQSSVCIRL